MEALEINRASVRDFLNVIFKRRYQFLLFFILAFTTVVVTTFLVKPVYEASARILVKTDREGIYVPTTESGNLVISLSLEEQINSEVEILKSISLAKEVELINGVVMLKPLVTYDTSLEKIRTKVKKLGLKENTVKEAIEWARSK